MNFIQYLVQTKNPLWFLMLHHNSNTTHPILILQLYFAYDARIKASKVPGGGRTSNILETTCNKIWGIWYSFEVKFWKILYKNIWGKLMLKSIIKKNTMQHNMCKGPHFASSKKMEGIILFHEGFSSLGILWTPLCLNIDMKGYIWDNFWCLKLFWQMLYELLISCKCWIVVFLNTLNFKVTLYLHPPLQSCWCN